MKKYVYIILSIFLTLLIGFVVYLNYPYITLKSNIEPLEKNGIYMAGDYILETNGNVKAEAEHLNTDEVGNYRFKYTVNNGPIIKTVYLEYEVIDTIAPIISIKKDSIIKKLHEELKLEDVLDNITVDEGEITFETDYDQNNPGIYTVKVIATDDQNNQSSQTYRILVKDNLAPVAFKTGRETRIKVGTDFNINNYIGYGDDCDPSPKVDVKGSVNTNVVGNYPLHVTVTDYSGNFIDWDMNVEVMNVVPEDKPSDKAYSFERFKQEYGKAGRKLGMDISEWQYDIDFNKIKNAGCEFVFMRVGFSHDGNLTLDYYFKDNVRKAKEVGMPIGVYVFFHDNSEEELLSTLDMMFNELQGVDLDLPIAFDWENFLNFQDYGLSFKDLNYLYDVFEKEVTKRGYEAILYSSQFYLNHVWSDTETRPVWLANYSDWPNYDKPYKFWQVLDWGKIDGIRPDANADFDIMFE